LLLLMLLQLLAARLLQVSWRRLLLAARRLLQVQACWRRLLLAAALIQQAQASCLQTPLQQQQRLASPAVQWVS
jgi:hypothetical protein